MQDPAIYTLNSGLHTLLIEGRENGTRLDKLLITNDLNFTPYCDGDSEPDGDVDGVDLVDVISSGAIGIDTFANELGRINCQ